MEKIALPRDYYQNLIIEGKYYFRIDDRREPLLIEKIEDIRIYFYKPFSKQRDYIENSEFYLLEPAYPYQLKKLRLSNSLIFRDYLNIIKKKFFKTNKKQRKNLSKC